MKSLDFNRRNFLKLLGLTPAALKPLRNQLYFTIVNHWHQAGVGMSLRKGVLNGRRYQDAFSLFYGVQQTMQAVDRWPTLVICLEWDSSAYESMHAEDPEFVENTMRPYIVSGKIDITGGTYSQPYSQLVGWQSNVRQLLEGRSVVRNLLRKEVLCFLVEEISFHPQLPQLLKSCGFRYASLQSQNNGKNRFVRESIVNWRGLDGTEIPTIPSNGAMISLTEQYHSFNDVIAKNADLVQPLICLWAEIWPPGFDWGASYVPLRKRHPILVPAVSSTNRNKRIHEDACQRRTS